MMSTPTGWSVTSSLPRVRYTKLPPPLAGSTGTVAHEPGRHRAPRRVRLQRLADSDFSSPTSGQEYACHDGWSATVDRSLSPGSLISNGFAATTPLVEKSTQKRQGVRHSRNSFDLGRRIFAFRIIFSQQRAMG